MKYFALIDGSITRLTEAEFEKEENEQLTLWGRAFIVIEQQDVECRIILQSKKVMIKEYEYKYKPDCKHEALTRISDLENNEWDLCPICGYAKKVK